MASSFPPRAPQTEATQKSKTRVYFRLALTVSLLVVLAVGIRWTWIFITTIDGGGSSPIRITSLPYTITASGSYQIGQDLSGTGGITINANQVTLDGLNHTLTLSTGNLVSIRNRTDVTVANLRGNKGVGIHGSDRITVRDSSFTDLLVTHLDAYTEPTPGYFSCTTHDPSTRVSILGNTIVGTGGQAKQVEFVGSVCGPCPRTNHLIANNVITSLEDTNLDEPLTLRLRCGTHNTVRNNTIRAQSIAHTLRLRDEANNNVIEGNVFWANTPVTGTARGPVGAAWITSGNNDKTMPSNNVFRNNLWRTEVGPSLNIQGIGTGNLFTNNIFWANSWQANVIKSGGGNNRLVHNTFYNSSTDATGSIALLDGSTAPGNNYQSNLYSSAASPRVFTCDHFAQAAFNGDWNFYSNTVAEPTFCSSASLASWATSAAPDEQHSVRNNPGLINPAGGDFRLMSSSSPAANLGGTYAGACPFGATFFPCVPAAGSLPSAKDTSPLAVALQPIANPVSGSVTLRVTASDGNGVAGVQFFVDGNPVGTEITTAPYQISWNSTGVTNGYHNFTAIARDRVGYTATAVPLTAVVVNGTDGIPPVVTINKPIPDATVSGGFVMITAAASDDISVRGVQFQLDGVNLQAEDAQAPYLIFWDSRTAANGPHRLRAIARDQSNNTVTSTEITVTVSN